jgi:hypothetical protein
MLRCRLLGHRFRVRSQGATMQWSCEWGCGAGGSKPYPSAEDAHRYATALDRSDHERLGRGAALGLFPLRLLRAIRKRRS